MPTKPNREYIVYMHTFPNGKRYVGITSKPATERWKHGFGYYSQPYINHAIKKYGWENVKHDILHSNLSKEEACAIEETLISNNRLTESEYGYNIANGGLTSGKHSAETRMKISANRKGKGTGEKNRLFGVDISGSKNPFFGKQHTQEARKKMREAHADVAGEKNPQAKAVLCDGVVFPCVRKCAEYYGVHRDIISGYLTGNRKISQRFKNMGLQYLGV